MFETYPHIAASRAHSSSVIDQVRAALGELSARDLPGVDRIAVVVCGSFGRGEGGANSDFDYYLLHDEAVDPEAVAAKVRDRLRRLGLRQPAEGGAFAELQPMNVLVSTIGGAEETNALMTRRLLLMLESDWAFNRPLFERILERLVEAYIPDHTTEQNLALFFLNDVIRYYRNICVDFEMKTRGERAKGWGVRNIKLVFSRKLLYFSGVIAAAETADLPPKDKRARLLELLRLPPLERLAVVFGPDRAAEALSLYDGFLADINRADTRRALDAPPAAVRETALYRDLKNRGHRFSQALLTLLRARYPQDHLIHTLLVL